MPSPLYIPWETAASTVMGADLPSDLVTVLKNHFPSLSPASSSRGGGDLCRSLQRCRKVGTKGTSYLHFAKNSVDEDFSAWVFCLG